MRLEWKSEMSAHDFDRGRVNFWAEAEGDRVLCAVSDEALQDIAGSHGADPDELVTLYRSHADEIGTIAEHKWLSGDVEPDGYVVVKSEDLR